MDNIFEQLRNAGQQCQPDFSESLHRRCMDAIENVQPSWASSVRTESSTTSSRRVPYKLVAISATILFVGFLVFNSIPAPVEQSASRTNVVNVFSTDQVLPKSEELLPANTPDVISIDSETWEQFEQVCFVSDQSSASADSKQSQESSDALSATAVSSEVASEAKVVSQVSSMSSMGNLLMQAGNLVQFSNGIASGKNTNQ